jgi:hypothetical protein
MCQLLRSFYGLKTMRSTAIVVPDRCGGRRLTTHPFEALADRCKLPTVRGAFDLA